MVTGVQHDLMKQTQYFWSMLDELAETDEDAYRKFMATNLQRGQQELTPAKPWMCVKTRIMEELTVLVTDNTSYVCHYQRLYKKTYPQPIQQTTSSPTVAMPTRMNLCICDCVLVGGFQHFPGTVKPHF
ncbi:PIH1 domain-containing protein 2-like [Patiria miniata]|uniref:Uncharacterized protein n=1 Tax=Patiria miniata TaxID=46514 RepID=A0A914AHT2_PATMI|nr:PIH1 domain-containing protein 2-like [Patiria miniata]